MKVIFFLPSIHRLPTGGNIFNQRMIDYLGSCGGIHLTVVTTDHTDEMTIPGHLIEKNYIVIIDSLWVRDEARIERLQRIFPGGKWILLAHYLQVLDPLKSGLSDMKRENEVLQKFDGIVVTSRYAKIRLVHHQFTPETIYVIEPGVDRIYLDSLPEKSEIAVPRLLTVSNFLPEKGLIEMIDMLESMTDLPWIWELVGCSDLDPEYTARFEQRLSHSTVRSRITVEKHLSGIDVYHRYDRSHIFMLPSRFESSSMVVREALCRGLHVVAYRVGGIPEIGGKRSPINLVTPWDSTAFRHTLKKVIHKVAKDNARKDTNQVNGRIFPEWRQAGEQFITMLKSQSLPEIDHYSL